MSEFKRSPSKVWWASESLEWREISSSPGSQDSGFSDTENSPPGSNNNNNNNNNINTVNNKPSKETPKKDDMQQCIPKDIFKTNSPEEKAENLSENFKEKITPNKTLLKNNGEKIRKYVKNSPKVSRNLFTNTNSNNNNNSGRRKESKDDLYAKGIENASEEEPVNCHSWHLNVESKRFEDGTKEDVNVNPNNKNHLNRTAPGNLENCHYFLEEDEYEEVTAFNHSLSSDCESELEYLFSAKHTSTPKGRAMRNSPRSSIIPSLEDGNRAVGKWLNETRQNYELECFTTLQSKSIMGDLSQKVSHLAAVYSTEIRGVLSQTRLIEMEYRNLNGSETKNIAPLIQSLTGNILEFFKIFRIDLDQDTLELIAKIRENKNDNLNLINKLFNLYYEILIDEILTKEVKRLVDQIEKPRNELELRAISTAITSLCLHHEELIELFIKAEIIPILLILCERCEGSSLRSLLLRSLTTVCNTSSAVRIFEKFSGIQIISDTIEDSSRPEPERSEAIALLAQVTAPWMEDNHSVKGLQDYAKKIVKSLTEFLKSTKCCQNLLLSIAALSNLSSMDTKCIKYILQNDTIIVVINVVKSHQRNSIYLLEQVANFLANASVLESARKKMSAAEAPVILLKLLQMNYFNYEEVEKRLQQKAIIALSRLSGDLDAAMQIVDNGGVDKLVKMCREKKHRFDNDTVLVAALATLRKIVDACGPEIMKAQDVQELVEPKLMDSFMAYSSQNESYV